MAENLIYIPVWMKLMVILFENEGKISKAVINRKYNIQYVHIHKIFKEFEKRDWVYYQKAKLDNKEALVRPTRKHNVCYLTTEGHVIGKSIYTLLNVYFKDDIK